MRILVLNGSPKGEKSNTMKLTHAFLNGMSEKASFEVEIIPVYKIKILPCIGCFSCWKKTPGKCCINDDMSSIIEKMLVADIIIWSFPLYYFGLPSQMKALMDRQLPMVLPFMRRSEGNSSDYGSHPSRYDMSTKRFILISTCGFYTHDGNYESIKLQFDRYLGKENYETLFCGQGELFSVSKLSTRINEYLQYVKIAGTEFLFRGITAEVKDKLSEPLYIREIFEDMANASWGITEDGKNGRI